MEDIKLKIRCTRTKDKRFILFAEYDLFVAECNPQTLTIVWSSEEGREVTFVPNRKYADKQDFFNKWHYECHWRDYDFELLPSNEIEVELI